MKSNYYSKSNNGNNMFRKLKKENTESFKPIYGQTLTYPKLLPTHELRYHVVAKKYTRKDEEKEKKTRGPKRKREQPYLWMEEPDDIYWPPIPGIDGPIELGDEPVGNLNKPPPIDPEEEEMYKNLYVPSAEEVYEEFLKGRPPEG